MLSTFARTVNLGVITETLTLQISIIIRQSHVDFCLQGDTGNVIIYKAQSLNCKGLGTAYRFFATIKKKILDVDSKNAKMQKEKSTKEIYEVFIALMSCTK